MGEMGETEMGRGQQGGGGGEELARTRSGEGRVDEKEWDGEGETGGGQWEETRRGQWGGGDGEGAI